MRYLLFLFVWVPWLFYLFSSILGVPSRSFFVAFLTLRNLQTVGNLIFELHVIFVQFHRLRKPEMFFFFHLLCYRNRSYHFLGAVPCSCFFAQNFILAFLNFPGKQPL